MRHCSTRAEGQVDGVLGLAVELDRARRGSVPARAGTGRGRTASAAATAPGPGAVGQSGEPKVRMGQAVHALHRDPHGQAGQGAHLARPARFRPQEGALYWPGNPIVICSTD